MGDAYLAKGCAKAQRLYSSLTKTHAKNKKERPRARFYLFSRRMRKRVRVCAWDKQWGWRGNLLGWGASRMPNFGGWRVSIFLLRIIFSLGKIFFSFFSLNFKKTTQENLSFHVHSSVAWLNNNYFVIWDVLINLVSLQLVYNFSSMREHKYMNYGTY